MRTILVTGFGPFPGAPYNPTAALVARLTRLRRPNARIVGHVFATEYAAVDRDLPRLIALHRPDALLMFGLHSRARTLRIETLARNALGRHRDAGGRYAKTRAIVPGATHARMLTPAARLVRAARQTGVSAAVSRDAGSYLCNYLCWRATETTSRLTPRFVAFVHVPPVARKALRQGSRRLRGASLETAALAMLAELTHCLGTAGMRT
jgi:pyroglutamyl-peptidase